MSIDNQFDLLTIKETASQLNISISTLRRLIKNKKIKAIKVGGGSEFRKMISQIFFLKIKKII